MYEQTGNRWKRTFFTIYAGQAFSLIGSAAVQFALIWWLTIQSGSALTLTLATLVSTLPSLVFGPFAGIWIDRYDRKTVMIAADALSALAALVLVFAFWFLVEPPLWLVYGMLFIRGIGNTFHTPAMQAAIPMFVPADQLVKAGGWGNLIVSLSTMLGTALGAFLMEILPLAFVMLVDVVGAVFAIGCLLLIHLPDLPRQNQKLHLIADLKEGWRAMMENGPLKMALLPILAATILYMPLGSLFPLLLRSHYLGTARQNALIQILFSGGLMASSLYLGVKGAKGKTFQLISAAIGVMGLAAALIGILPSGCFWGFALCCLVMGATGTFFNVPLMAYIQKTIPPLQMGKVFSTLSAAMNLAAPFGLLIAGPLGEQIGVDHWFLWSGLLMVLIGFLCYQTTKQYDRSNG